MTFERVLNWLPLVVLILTLFVAKVRALLLWKRGQRVVVVDWKRPISEMLLDTLLIAFAFCWVYLLVADAVPFSVAWLPRWLTANVVDVLPMRLLGAAMLLAAPLLYAISLLSFETSWRIGIDRKRPPPLVSGGIFACTRNPIYTAFDLIFMGAFLVYGRVIFLLLGVALILLIHGIVIREERFLEEQFGDEFREYKSRVRRYGVI